MSQTYYVELNDVFEDIKKHYADENLYIEEIDGELTDDCIEIVQDAFVGESSTYVTIRFEDKFGNDIMYIISMTTTTFKSEWAEKVWSKFRADRKVVCKLCGEKSAEFVSGATYLERLEQFYCESCNEAYITNTYGKFIRKGTLSEPIDYRDYQ